MENNKVAKIIDVIVSVILKLILTVTGSWNRSSDGLRTVLEETHISENLLVEAIYKKDIPLIKKLLESKTDLEKQGTNGNTPFMQAASMENLEIAELLLKSGANVNGKGYQGATALHCAVNISIDGTIQSGGVQGDEPTEMILFLLSKGADTSITDTEVGTPLDWAKSYASRKIIKVLTDYPKNHAMPKSSLSTEA